MQEIRAWISSFALKYIIYTGVEIMGQGIRWGFILFIYYFSFFLFFFTFFLQWPESMWGQKYHVCFTKMNNGSAVCHGQFVSYLYIKIIIIMGNVLMDRIDKHPKLISQSEADILIMIFTPDKHIYYIL